MEWNSDEWQGRTKDHVERNNRVFGYTVIGMVIVIGLMLIISVIIK